MRPQEYSVLKDPADSDKHGNQLGSIHSVQTLAAAEPAFNEGGIRWTIFQHKQDLIDCGAIFYSGKKLLIDRNRFISFLQNGRTAA